MNIKLKRWTHQGAAQLGLTITKHEQTNLALKHVLTNQITGTPNFHHSKLFTLPETKIASIKIWQARRKGSSSNNQLTGSMLASGRGCIFYFGPFDVGQPPKRKSLSTSSVSTFKAPDVFRRRPAVSERHHSSAVGRRPIESARWLRDGWSHVHCSISRLEAFFDYRRPNPPFQSVITVFFVRISQD